MLTAGIALALFAAFIGGSLFGQHQARPLHDALRDTIREARADTAAKNERIRQLEHTLDEARALALNLTLPSIRDAELRSASVLVPTYEAELLAEISAIEDEGHRAEYIETIEQMRRENPSVTDRTIRLTLFP